jgi:formamidopyrimidine-DNA glycosylase
MPELPEVEHVRRSLVPALVGASIQRVELRRRDIVRGGDYPQSTTSKHPSKLLLKGDRITSLERHGKNLVIVGESGRVICVHLGMSGQMLWRALGAATHATKENRRATGEIRSPVGARLNGHQLTHAHCVWAVHLRHGKLRQRGGHLIFRDPRRFGGLWLYESLESLCKHRLAKLGPDALTISPAGLREALCGKKTSIKSALLDQRVLAGVGNIYADEALFASRIHPRRKAGSLSHEEVAALARAIRNVLKRAIKAGGSTIRTYVDSTGSEGAFANYLKVYGRGGMACTCCRKLLRQLTVAQRTTVCCEQCQPYKRTGSRTAKRGGR